MFFRLISEVAGWIKAIMLAFIFAVLISVFIIQPYAVIGSSMEPSLEGADLADGQGGDRVIVFKAPYLLGNMPEYGEMVVVDSRVHMERTWKDTLLESPAFAYLTNSDTIETHAWIKRIVGLPGDKIEVSGGAVYRNGELVEEAYIKEEIYRDFHPVVVPDDSVFVMGDNRNASMDSRSVGPIPIDNIIGKVVLRYYPFDRFDFFQEE